MSSRGRYNSSPFSSIALIASSQTRIARVVSVLAHSAIASEFLNIDADIVYWHFVIPSRQLSSSEILSSIRPSAYES